MKEKYPVFKGIKYIFQGFAICYRNYYMKKGKQLTIQKAEKIALDLLKIL